MISGIKIYKTDGSLKKEISKEKALKLYDEQNKKNWALSPKVATVEKAKSLSDLY